MCMTRPALNRSLSPGLVGDSAAGAPSPPPSQQRAVGPAAVGRGARGRRPAAADRAEQRARGPPRGVDRGDRAASQRAGGPAGGGADARRNVRDDVVEIEHRHQVGRRARAGGGAGVGVVRGGKGVAGEGNGRVLSFSARETAAATTLTPLPTLTRAPARQRTFPRRSKTLAAPPRRRPRCRRPSRRL